MHVSAQAELSERGVAAPIARRGGPPGGPRRRFYHGSRAGADITRFSVCHSQMDPGERGIYFTDCPEHASQYALGWGEEGVECGGVVYPVHLDVARPYVVTSEEWGRGVGLSPEEARARGHDAYVIRGQEGADTYIVFDGDRVSFAIGAGRHDCPEPPDEDVAAESDLGVAPAY